MLDVPAHRRENGVQDQAPVPSARIDAQVQPTIIVSSIPEDPQARAIPRNVPDEHQAAIIEDHLAVGNDTDRPKAVLPERVPDRPEVIGAGDVAPTYTGQPSYDFSIKASPNHNQEWSPIYETDVHRADASLRHRSPERIGVGRRPEVPRHDILGACRQNGHRRGTIHTTLDHFPYGAVAPHGHHQIAFGRGLPGQFDRMSGVPGAETADTDAEGFQATGRVGDDGTGPDTTGNRINNEGYSLEKQHNGSLRLILRVRKLPGHRAAATRPDPTVAIRPACDNI